MSRSADEAAITSLVERFFAAFVSGPDAARHAATLRELLLPEARIVRACGPITVYGVEEFIAPRVELLSSGSLVEFREWPTSGRTELFGDVAQHWCSYEKSWLADGVRQHGQGWKTLQFVRTPAGWRIAAAAWDDER